MGGSRPWSKGSAVEISVATMTGAIVEVTVGREDTVLEVKKALQDEVRLLPAMQQLYLRDEALDDAKVLSSYAGVADPGALKVIGARPGSVPMNASRARLLARYMDTSATAKEASRADAKQRLQTFEAQQRSTLEREEALQLAHDCGKRFAGAAQELRNEMREKLLAAGYIEANQAAIDLQVALKQRDYLIQRQVGLLRKNGGLLSGFVEELGSMVGITPSREPSDVRTFAASVVEGAEEARQKVEPLLNVSADIARQLRDARDVAVRRLESKKEEVKVLSYDLRALKVEIHRLEKLAQREELRHNHRIADVEAKVAELEREVSHHRKHAAAHAPSYKLVRELFDRSDVDGNGALEGDEIKALSQLLSDAIPGKKLTPAELVLKMRSLDRDKDGSVDFEEFFAWYERELTDARMSGRALYPEVRKMFDKLDADASGELEQAEIVELAESLIQPVDDVTGAPRPLTEQEVDDIMVIMDRDGQGTVGFEEFFYWYETDMKERKARAENDAKMARFEAEAMARAQRIAESALFGLADDGDDPEAIAAANILAATQASRPRGGGDEAATPAAPSTGGAGSGDGAGSKLWTQMVQGEVDPHAAAQKVAAKLGGRAAALRNKATTAKEVEAVQKKLDKAKKKKAADDKMLDAEKSMAGFKKLSLAEKREFRAAKSKKQNVGLARVKLSAKINTCARCGDRFTGELKFTYLGHPYCSQYCHSVDTLGDDDW